MEKKDLINYVVTILLATSAGIAGMTFDDAFKGELSSYYICSLNENILQFNGGISSTGYTGYPFKDSRKGAVTCGTTENKGTWNKLEDYAKSKGIDPYELILKEIPEDTTILYKDVPGAVQYTCPQNAECFRI